VWGGKKEGRKKGETATLQKFSGGGDEGGVIFGGIEKGSELESRGLGYQLEKRRKFSLRASGTAGGGGAGQVGESIILVVEEGYPLLHL